MKFTTTIILALICLVATTELSAQTGKATTGEPELESRWVKEEGTIYENVVTKWIQVDLDPPTIGNSQIYDDGSLVTIGQLGSGLFHPERLQVNGRFNLKESLEFKSDYGDISWGNKAEEPGRLTFLANAREYTKFIMALDGLSGNVGIGTLEPSCALEIHTLGPVNTHALIASDNGTNRIFMVPGLSNSGFNPLSIAGDIGLFWSDNAGVQNNHSGLVIAPHASSTYGLRITNEGYIGIGLNNPEGTLHVSGNTISTSLRVEEETQTRLLTVVESTTTNSLLVETGTTTTDLSVNNLTTTKKFKLYDEAAPPQAGFILGSDAYGNGTWINPNSFNQWITNPNNPDDIYFPAGTNGNVGIGTVSTYGYRLAVKGKILTDEVMVSDPDTWSDFVFEPDYKLRSIQEVESFIAKNKHLPDVPSEKEVMENGYGLSEMNSILLQKIEELTLYIIDQQKAIEAQREEINELKSVVKTR